METRNSSLTLEKAIEFYNSGNAALREVALQAFTKEELITTLKFTGIKTFEDAVKALGLCICDVEIDLEEFDNHRFGGNTSEHLKAIYKLDIIRKALNGDWEPKMTEGNIYYGWVRFYLPNKKPSGKETIATLKIDGQKYLLVGGFRGYGSYAGLGYFYSGVGCGYSYPYLGLLCCKSGEIAEHMSQYFGKEIFEACYAQHIGAYEWVEEE